MNHNNHRRKEDRYGGLRRANSQQTKLLLPMVYSATSKHSLNPTSRNTQIAIAHIATRYKIHSFIRLTTIVILAFSLVLNATGDHRALAQAVLQQSQQLNGSTTSNQQQQQQQQQQHQYNVYGNSSSMLMTMVPPPSQTMSNSSSMMVVVSGGGAGNGPQVDTGSQPSSSSSTLSNGTAAISRGNMYATMSSGGGAGKNSSMMTGDRAMASTGKGSLQSATNLSPQGKSQLTSAPATFSPVFNSRKQPQQQQPNQSIRAPPASQPRQQQQQQQQQAVSVPASTRITGGQLDVGGGPSVTVAASGAVSKTPVQREQPQVSWRPRPVAPVAVAVGGRAGARQYGQGTTIDPQVAANSIEQEAGADERPRPGGYSYDEPASAAAPTTMSASPSTQVGGYTHTSPLSPAKAEMLLAGQANARRRAQMMQQQQSMMASGSGQQSVGRAYYDYGGSSGGGGGSSGRSEDQVTQQQQRVSFPVSQSHLSAGVDSAYAPRLGIAPLNPCRPALADGLTQQQQANLISGDLSAAASSQVIGAPSPLKYVRVAEGTRLRSPFVFKVLRADSLTDCELACARSQQPMHQPHTQAGTGTGSVAGVDAATKQVPQQVMSAAGDVCKSFNYRPYFAAENCELSRVEWRQLAGRFDDPSQFEQNTQFDFYALITPATTGMQQQQQQQQQPPAHLSAALLAGQQQLVGPIEPLGGADCLDVAQSCSPDGMEFTLRTSEPFNGRIYTYGFHDSCYFDGEGSTQSVLRITRSNGFPRCGTQQYGDMMTNIVVVQFNDHVQTTRDKKYNLTCFFSGPGEAVVTSNYLDTKLDARSHPIQIERLPPQNIITSNVQLKVLYRGQPTNTIAVGDLLTFRLETTPLAKSSQFAARQRAGDTANNNNAQALPQTEIFATNVIAKDPYSGKQVLLIDAHGCPVDSVNVFPELQRTPDGSLESEFYAFKIPDSNFLIFQATVRTCLAPCQPVICRPPLASVTGADHTRGHPAGTGIKGSGSGSGSSAQYIMPQIVPSWGKRRRRSLDLASADTYGDEYADGSEQSQLAAAAINESIEHVIPVRLRNGKQSPSTDQSQPTTTGVRTFRRPELSEAEEQVKEMFRVYMSRAEINKQNQRQRNSAAHLRQRPHSSSMAAAAEGEEMAKLRSPGGAGEALIETEDTGLRDQLICVTKMGFYSVMFAMISLTLLVVSLMSIGWFVTRTNRTKFHIGSSSLSDAMF